MKKTLLACSILFPVLAQAQIKIGNNPGTIDPGSILELEHPNKALYMSRVSLTSTTDLTTVPNPKAGMTVYNTNTAITSTVANPALTGGIGLYVFDGTRWVGAGPGAATGNFWRLDGNAGLTTNDFIGTTDAQQFAIRTNNTLRALYRPDGSIAMGNSAPVYSDTKFEINLADVGGSQTSGEQNGGVNVLASSLNASALSVALRGRMDVANGKTIAGARGVQGNVSISGAASGGVTGGYFNAAMKSGGSLGAAAGVTGVAADAEAGTGTGTTAATNSFIGGRFGANAANAAVSRATGVFSAANNSTTSNVGVYALANDPTYANYLVFNNGLPVGFSSAVVGFNPGNGANNYSGYFYGKNKTANSSVTRTVADPGAVAPGTELFAASTSLTATDGANASSSPTTLRAQVNQTSSTGNNVRTQGSLNEASSSGTGLGQYNQPQANGATGLGDYVGSSDAPVSDYIVGLRGAAYTSGSRTNGLNVVGVNFGGTYFRSVGGYFAPSAGTDANLGIVAQTGGTANSGWRDAQFAGKNISVAAINTGTTANDYAGYFTGSNNATASSVLRAVNNAGAVADGADLFASHNSVTGTNANAVGNPATIRAQYNNATSASNNLRVQGALNEASSSGTGLGANATPQATGVTGLADYTGTSDAPAADFLVGVRGATYTSSNKTNGLNIVGQNFGGNFNRSVGGYFAPTNGTDANLGVVAQNGGTSNQAWQDPALSATDAAVAAIDYSTSTTTNHAALITRGPVRMSQLNGTGTNLVTIDPLTGALGSVAAPAPAPAGWTLNGNAGTTPANFIGTTDAQKFEIRTNNTLRAIYRADGSFATGNSAPVYTDNKYEINLADVGGSQTSGEQNGGVNVLASSLNASALSVAVRGRMDVANGKTIAGARGVQGNVSISGAASGGVTGGYFNAAMKSGGSLGAAAGVTGVAADAEAGTGTGTTAATNSFIGGRFGANAANAAVSRATGVFSAANNSTTSNVGVYALANDPTYANYLTFNNGLPAGFSAAVVGFNPANAANNYSGYFYGKNKTQYSAAARVISDPGNAIAPGTELFGGQTTISGTDGANASASPTTLRAQVNQTSSTGNNVRTQGSLNEASSSGTGLGQYDQPQANGATGLGDYVGSSDAPVSDYIVGLRGAAYTSGSRTNGLNVVGVNFGGTYFRSVGGYFAPSAGTDANLGIVAQTGGTANSGWRDAQFAGKNISVAAINTGTTANDYAGYFTGANNATASSVLRAVNNAGAVADGSDLFASHNSITGTNASAVGTPATLRAQYNNASSASNNLRVQGALNEASTSGTGLGVNTTPQATGVTGLADYNGTTDAPTTDYLVGVRGATYTSSNKTNGLNVVGANFSGAYFRSVGGYFAPTAGSDANLGVVAQTGGTENQAWQDASLANTNVGVTAIDYNTAGNHLAMYTSGPVRMRALPATPSTTTVLTIDPTTGNVGTRTLPTAGSITTATNGLTVTGSNVMLGGSLNGTTNLGLGNYNLCLTGGSGSLGIGTTSPGAKLMVEGSFGTAIRTTTITVNLNEAHHTIVITGGTPTMNLPGAGTCAGRIYRIVNTTATALAFNSSYTAFTGATSTIIPANNKIVIQSDGVNWYQID